MAVDYDSKKYLESVDAYWRAANYLSVGTLFLMGDPLLRQPLKAEDVKPKPIVCLEYVLLLQLTFTTPFLMKN